MGGQTEGTDTLPQHPRVGPTRCPWHGGRIRAGAGAVTEQEQLWQHLLSPRGAHPGGAVLEMTGDGSCVPTGWGQTRGQAGDSQGSVQGPDTHTHPSAAGLEAGQDRERPLGTVGVHPSRPPSREGWSLQPPGGTLGHHTATTPPPPPPWLRMPNSCHLWPGTGWTSPLSSKPGLGCGTGALGILCTPPGSSTHTQALSIPGSPVPPTWALTHEN